MTFRNSPLSSAEIGVRPSDTRRPGINSVVSSESIVDDDVADKLAALKETKSDSGGPRCRIPEPAGESAGFL